MAGYKVLWANEFIPAAQETYKANHPNSFLNTKDIRNVIASDILRESKMSVGDIDIFDGSPPCSAFSQAGKREKGWNSSKKYSDTRQRVDDLFFEYIRLLDGLQPKVFVAENVAGLIQGTAKGYFIDIIKKLKKCGYKVTAKVLNAAYLGVPQNRERIIFVGVRDDLGLAPVHPKPLPYFYTFADAMPACGYIDGESWILKDGKTKRCWQWLKKHNLRHFEKASKALYNKTSMYTHVRCTNDRPSNTVVCSTQCLYHPDYPRSLSIEEIKRICTFPDDFLLTGKFHQKWERIGRAVPPIMMSHIAKTIQLKILEKIS